MRRWGVPLVGGALLSLVALLACGAGDAPCGRYMPFGHLFTKGEKGVFRALVAASALGGSLVSTRVKSRPVGRSGKLAPSVAC